MPIPSGRIHAWSLDEQSGGSIHDSIGSLTISNSSNNPSWLIPGRFGASAIQYDRISQQISYEVTDNALFTGNQPFTVSLFVRLDDTSYGGIRYLFGFGEDLDGQSFQIWTAVNRKINAALYYQMGAVTPTEIPNNTWVHITTTFDGSLTKIYIDGALSATSTPGLANFVNGNNTIFIGGRYFYGEPLQNFAKASIDEIYMWNRSLSASEVEELYEYFVIDVSPTSWSFGNVTNLSTTDKTVTVSNIGDSSLVMGTLSGLAAPFSLVNNNVSGATINPSDSSTVVVRYSPTTVGVSVDTLVIPSNDSSTPYLFNVDGTSQAAVIGVAPSTSWNFGDVANLSTTDKTVTVSNSGNLALVMGTLSGLASPFSLVNNNVSGATINPSDSSTVVVRYQPTVIGDSTDVLIIPSNDSGTPYNLTVYGRSLEADISVSPTFWHAGIVEVGFSVSREVTVTNIGNSDLVMTPVIGAEAPFSITNDNVSGATIVPAASASLTVVFNPQTPGYKQGSLFFNSNDPDTASFRLALSGDARPHTAIFTTGRVLSGGMLYDYVVSQ